MTEAVGEATGAIDEVTGAIDEGLQVELAEQNASGQSGTATLSPGADGTVNVAIELSNPPADPQPAHIHEGTCGDLNPEPVFPLNNVVNGSSETDVEAMRPYLTRLRGVCPGTGCLAASGFEGARKG